MRAEVTPELRGLEETHAAVCALVGFLGLLLVRLLVCLAVSRVREALAAHRAGERLLARVHPLVSNEFVVFAERLHAIRTRVRDFGFLGVRAYVPLQLGRPVENLSAVRTGVLV